MRYRFRNYVDDAYDAYKQKVQTSYIYILISKFVAISVCLSVGQKRLNGINIINIICLLFL